MCLARSDLALNDGLVTDPIPSSLLSLLVGGVCERRRFLQGSDPFSFHPTSQEDEDSELVVLEIGILLADPSPPIVARV